MCSVITYCSVLLCKRNASEIVLYYIVYLLRFSSRQSRVRQQARISLSQLRKLSQAGMIPPGMTDAIATPSGSV